MNTATSIESLSTGNFVEGRPPLGVAKEKLSCALKALTLRDYACARDLAEQAEMEAHMVERHAQSADMRKAAYESHAAARVLRREIDRIDALLFDHKPTH